MELGFHPGGRDLTLEAAKACGWKEGDRILDIGCGDGAAQAASLRVRIWPEYPEHYLSEIIWASKPDCGISTTRKASPNLRHRQARARNKELIRDSRLQTFPLR